MKLPSQLKIYLWTFGVATEKREQRRQGLQGPHILPRALSRPEMQRTQAAGICKVDGCQEEGVPGEESPRGRTGGWFSVVCCRTLSQECRGYISTEGRVARLDVTVLRAQRGWETEFQWAKNEESHGMPRTLREAVLRWEKISPLCSQGC